MSRLCPNRIMLMPGSPELHQKSIRGASLRSHVPQSVQLASVRTCNGCPCVGLSCGAAVSPLSRVRTLAHSSFLTVFCQIAQRLSSRAICPEFYLSLSVLVPSPCNPLQLPRCARPRARF